MIWSLETMLLRIINSSLLVVVGLAAPMLGETGALLAATSGASGPSIDVTMKFIQEKLNEQGEITYYVRDGSDGSDSPTPMLHSSTNVRADTGTCRISYHLKEAYRGSDGVGGEKWFFAPDKAGDPIPDRDVSFNLSDVQSITVKTGEAYTVNRLSRIGISMQAKVLPDLFVLTTRRPNNQEDVFMFLDEMLANRVAKALIHAVELCGGGNKDPF
jgi:hypothetical protein